MALHLPITGTCNIRCLFCSAHGRRADYGLSALLAEIDADASGHVQVSGGEPLLKNPAELLKILLHCRKKGKLVEFQTNGVMLARHDAKRLGLLIVLVDFFNVNFSAHTPALDLAVTKTPGAFEARLAGVRRLLALRARVRLNFIVHEANYRHAEDFVNFAARELPGFEWLQFSYCKGMGRAKGDRRVMPRFQDVAPHLNAAFQACERLGVSFDIDHIPVCFVGDFKERHVDYRKMRQRQPGAHLLEKQRVADCEPCAMRQSCPGPRRDYIEVYGPLARVRPL